RAALVDRLLSAALNTEFLMSGLEESRVRGGSGGGSGGLDDCGEGAEGPYGFDDDFVSSSGFANSFGALDGSDTNSSSSSSSSSDEEGEEEQEETVKGEVKGFCAARAVAAAVAAAASFAPSADVRSAAEDSSSGSAAGESVAAGREGVLRLYGAVLIKLRVSVFLFCSASAAEAAVDRGPGGSRQGPSELTLRRQGVMSGENLEAVAMHLRSLRGDGKGGGGCGRSDGDAATWGETWARAGGLRRARDWMRVEVGRAALCKGRGGGGGGGSDGGGDGVGRSADFSTRVAALLLSRSGERGGLPGVSGSRGGSAALSAKQGAAEGARGRGRWLLGEGPETAVETGGKAAAAAAAFAAAEEQFRRDPWPEGDLPRASEQ
ncbi:unnamed protein product, partial [Hapterophycus canaliculatus]